MVRLRLNNEDAIELCYKQPRKFDTCMLNYYDNGNKIMLSEDYLYVFVEDILGALRNIITIEDIECMGKIGKWQEYFYYSDIDNKLHKNKIDLMKKATLVSTEQYGLFIYKCQGKIWIEINCGYDEQCGLSPIDYYGNSNNYRMALIHIDETLLMEWEEELCRVKELFTDE